MGKNSIVSVRGVGKKYSMKPRVHAGTDFKSIIKHLLLLNTSGSYEASDEFWALKNVSFDLTPGSAVGVIGRNGSGKTTLMKIVTELISQDEGSVEINGSVQAMINLGAGFDKSLSGRENIMNAAAIRGFGPGDISSRIEDIITFSELAEFIDSPVENYSSGMAARLGFSLCVHLNPDIIIIDEALSVGDESFRNKCLSKLEELKARGVAMLLVSHSMTQIAQFCETAIWLAKGEVQSQGNVKDVISDYQNFIEKTRLEPIARKPIDKAAGPKGAESDKLNIPEYLVQYEARSDVEQSVYGPLFQNFDKLEALSFGVLIDGKPENIARPNSSIKIGLYFKTKQEFAQPNISFNLCRDDGQLLWTLSTLNHLLWKDNKAHENFLELNVKKLNLPPGKYQLILPIHAGRSYIYRGQMQSFEIVDASNMYWGWSAPEYDFKIK